MIYIFHFARKDYTANLTMNFTFTQGVRMVDLVLELRFKVITTASNQGSVEKIAFI